MKNFPHQFNDLTKLTGALDVARAIIGGGQDYNDDGVFGAALAMAGIYAFRDKNLSVAENIQAEQAKPVANQGFRTAARDVRRFLSIAGLVGPAGVTQAGADILNAAGNTALRNSLWRNAMLNLTLTDAANQTSHPYRILVKLAADRPGIETRKLLLALEARNDSPEEYLRILQLADASFDAIVAELDVSQPNARNAIKILPGIAEQIGDIVRDGNQTYPAVAQLATTEDALIGELETGALNTTQYKSPKSVTADAIATIPNFSQSVYTTADLTAAIAMLQQRTIEHNNTVTALAKLIAADGFTLYKDPFDCLANKKGSGSLLIEVKTLNGTPADERNQTGRALGQLRGYSYYNVAAELKSPSYREVVAFSKKPTLDAVSFLSANSIRSAWSESGHWLVTSLTGDPVPFLPTALLTS